MKQCSTFEDLQALGIEKIHERTHISRDKIELVISKSFSEIGRVQFMGYISILEREYGIDLSEIKEEYRAFYQNNVSMITPKSSVILQAASNSKPKWIMVGIVLIIVLMVGGYFLQGKMSTEPSEDVMNLTTLAVQVTEKVNDVNISKINETNVTVPVMSIETNQSLPTVMKNEANQSKTTIAKPFVSGTQIAIRPKYKVWYGMIDLSNNQRIQNITDAPIVIDMAKDWLIVLGHGRVEIESSEGKKLLNDKNTVHFIYEKGILKQIREQEFIARNGGKNW